MINFDYYETNRQFIIFSDAQFINKNLKVLQNYHRPGK